MISLSSFENGLINLLILEKIFSFYFSLKTLKLIFYFFIFLSSNPFIFKFSFIMCLKLEVELKSLTFIKSFLMNAPSIIFFYSNNFFSLLILLTSKSAWTIFMMEDSRKYGRISCEFIGIP